MAEISEQIIREAPNIEAYKIGLLESAKKLSEQQMQLPGYQAAPLSTLQQSAMGLATQGIGGYQPFVQAGQRSMEAGIGSLGAGANLAAGVNVAPQYGTAQGALQSAMGATSQLNVDPQYGTAQGALRSAMGATSRVNVDPQYGTAQNALQYAMGQSAGPAGGYQPGMEQPYMNPYQQAVTQQSLMEMRRQADIARQGQAAQAVQAGAFGGTREGVQRAEFERGVQDLMSQRVFQDYAQNYGQAQLAARQDFEQQQQRGLQQTGQLGQLSSAYGQLAGQQGQLGLQQAGQLGQLGSAYGQLAGQQGQLGLQQSGQLGQLGSAYGQLAGQQGQLGLQQAGLLGQFGTQYGQLGMQQGALGEGYQKMGLQDINTLATLGGTQQQQRQAELEAARATQLQQTMAPYQQTAFLSDIYKGAPSSQMSLTGTSAPTTSPLLQAAGLGVSGLASYAGASKAGLFG